MRAMGVALAVIMAATAAAAEAFKADFVSWPAEGWSVASGEWKAEGGWLSQKDTKWGRHMVMSPCRLEEGAVTVKARVDEADKTSGGSFGVVLRYADSKTWTAVRLGAYGGASAWQVNGPKASGWMGFAPERGKSYEVKVELKAGVMSVAVDGKTLGEMKLAEPGAPGTVGFYTECQASFTGLEVSGTWRLEAPPAVAPAAAPVKAETAAPAAAPAAAPRPRSFAEGPVFRADFNGPDPLRGWTPAAGAWKVVDGALSQTAASWGRQVIFPRVRLEEGAVQARMRVDAEAAPSGGSFGFALRYPGEKGFTVLRLGAYGGAGVQQPVKDAPLQAFKPEIGKFYLARAELVGDTLTAFVDGVFMGSATLTDAKGPGFIGLYTECRATFDDLAVEGRWVSPGSAIEREPGKPCIQVEFAEWSPSRADPQTPVSVQGAAFVYFRNTGDGSAVLDRATLNGVEVDPVSPPEWVSYVRQIPSVVKPGGVGVVEARLCGLPREVGVRMLTHPGEASPMRLEMTHLKAGLTQCVVDVAGRQPLQINFIGFSEDLRTLYVYLQNNAAMADAKAPAIELTGLEVNGEDVTKAARFGVKPVAADIAPVVVSLARPLPEGRAVRVVAVATGGLRTGHTVRAFPSKFNILVCASTSARKDWMEDIYYHCATAINRAKDEAKRAELGFDLIPMSGSVATNPAAFIGKPIAAVWVDEVDKANKTPAAQHVAALQQAQETMEERGDRLPIINFNVCSPQGSLASGLLTAPDTVMHSYGWHMCPATRKGFGRLYDLPFREYRMARKPFWPYYRDSEIAVPRDVESKTMKPRIKEFQRCLTPKEQRWLTYGNLIQGAKSMGHWGYWAYPMSKFYFMWDTNCLRLGLGGVAGNKVGPYVIEDAVVKMLREVWDEHGRINAELQVIGPLVAVSDVSHLARVTKVKPELDRHGDPAAEAAALVSGLDTMVVVVLNHAMDPGESPGKSGPVSNPEPPKWQDADVEVEVKVPAWLKPEMVFSVDWKEIADVKPAVEGGALRFAVKGLEVSKVFVITSDPEVKKGCLARHGEMKKRLEKMAAIVPAPDEEWQDKNVK